MSRYDLRPSLLEDTLQEFELVRFQGVEWGRLKKRHRTFVPDVEQHLPVRFCFNSSGEVGFRKTEVVRTSHDDWFRVAKLGCRHSFNPR
jgi:hypothetical protein